MRNLLIFILLLAAMPALGAWKIDAPHSSLSFVSIKKNTVAESHQFERFTGMVNNQGIIHVAVDLASVNTNIEIRDQRMKEHLFVIKQFPQATFSASLPMKKIEKLPHGETINVSIKGEIDLHGLEQAVTMLVSVTKVSDTKIIASTVKPFVINAADFDLVAGIEQLKSLAKLPSIAVVVPVTFTLLLTK